MWCAAAHGIQQWTLDRIAFLRRRAAFSEVVRRNDLCKICRQRFKLDAGSRRGWQAAQAKLLGTWLHCPLRAAMRPSKSDGTFLQPTAVILTCPACRPVERHGDGDGGCEEGGHPGHCVPEDVRLTDSQMPPMKGLREVWRKCEMLWGSVLRSSSVANGSWKSSSWELIEATSS